MRGEVSCKFLGGPNGDETLILSPMMCRDTVSITSDTWLAKGAKDQVRIMKGPIPLRAPWLAFARDVYQKVYPTEHGNIAYRYLRTEKVTRCEKILEGKNRRCRNEAKPGSHFCKVHDVAL